MRLSSLLKLASVAIATVGIGRAQVIVDDTTSSQALAINFGRNSLNVHTYVAQSFMTPSQALTLTSVSVVFEKVPGIVVVPDIGSAQLELSLIPDSNGVPDPNHPLLALTGPTDMAGANGTTTTLNYTGTFPLNPLTTYWIYAYNVNGTAVSWWSTDTPTISGTGSLGPSSKYVNNFGSGSWQNDSTHSLLLAVTAVPEPMEGTVVTGVGLAVIFLLRRRCGAGQK